MTTKKPEPENTLPKEFASHLADAFSENFHKWAHANNLPQVIIDGVESALFIADCGQMTDVKYAGEHIVDIANAIVVMGGEFHTGGSFTVGRQMLMLAPSETQTQAGHDSNLLDEFIAAQNDQNRLRELLKQLPREQWVDIKQEILKRLHASSPTIIDELKDIADQLQNGDSKNALAQLNSLIQDASTNSRNA